MSKVGRSILKNKSSADQKPFETLEEKRKRVTSTLQETLQVFNSMDRIKYLSALGKDREFFAENTETLKQLIQQYSPEDWKKMEITIDTLKEVM